MKAILKILISYIFLMCFTGLGYLYAQPTNYDREWGTYGDYVISFAASSVVDGSDNLFVSYVSAADPLYVKSTIDKFSSDGELLLRIPFEAHNASVYIDDIKLDQNQDLIICGWTNSLYNFGTTGAWQEENAGFYDRFLAKLNSETGEVLWSTYFGGPANDEDGEDDNFWEYNSLIAITATNDIVWTTNMRSEDMGTAGVFQEQRGGNAANYVISMFNTTGERVWTTYYGYDHSNISGLQVDGSGIYVAGQTGGNVGFSEPYFDPSNTWTVIPYQTEAYISKFDFTGNRLWSTYFGGNASEYLLKNTLGQTKDNLYLTGSTYSGTGITSEGTYLPSIDNFTESSFLVQFDKDGTYQWGTYLGEVPNYGGGYSSIMTNENVKNIYVVGTAKNEGMATPSAYQEVLRGNSDAFVLEFDDTGQRLFGTYYGGENDEDGLFTVSSLFSGGFYLTAMTNSQTDIATPRAHQETYPGDSSYRADALFITKFVQAPLGISNVDNCDNNFIVYPVPAKETISLRFNECTSFSEGYKGNIYNSLGQKIASFESSENLHALNISKLPKGIYHLRINMGNNTLSESFIKE